MVAPSRLNSAVLEQLHLDALPITTRKAFLHSIHLPFFSSSGWYLAGGTALALQVGHRQSVDLDFFTSQETFSEKAAAETLDIAVMKVVAISQRGRKRDFIDLYWLCRHQLTLLESIERAERQYNVKQNRNHLLKSLVYFEDAEADPMPTLFSTPTGGR